MRQFNFTQTIMRYAQDYVLTKLNNIAMLKGREDVTESTVPVIMSLQPMSKQMLKMLESGDWDSAEYVGFQYPTDNLPILKDEMRGTSKGDLKCIAVKRWDDYGVYVSGWARTDAFQSEAV